MKINSLMVNMCIKLDGKDKYVKKNMTMNKYNFFFLINQK